jgi:Holliday junction DNA helicase RuvA
VISFLRGSVVAVGPTIVVDVGGIGLEVHPTARLGARVVAGAAETIPAAMVVREDGWTLYGFTDADERSTFLALQAAKGVGPRVALNLLSVMTPEELRTAVHQGDAAALTVAPGIGAKGAQRLVIDLRDRLPAPAPGPAPTAGRGRPAPARPAAAGWRADVATALVGLGWSAPEAGAAVAAVASAVPAGEAPDVPAMLRLAMQHLAGGRTAERVR